MSTVDTLILKKKRKNLHSNISNHRTKEKIQKTLKKYNIHYIISIRRIQRK